MFDIAFVGHMCVDEILPYRGVRTVTPGSAVLCGAMAAARVGTRVAVITKMSEQDRQMLDSMDSVGITTFLIPSEETTYMKVIYPTEDVDERELIQVKSAGYFTFAEIPEFQARYVHLAGITDQEFTVGFIQDMKRAGHNLTVDVQSFVRQVDPGTGLIKLRDVPAKKDILGYFSKIKSDSVEAKILTGASDIEEAAIVLESWGCQETLVTQATGVLARVNLTTYFEKLTNRTDLGRTGRGDTTFAGYLAWRINHDVGESIRFASAIASMKLEKPGPFSGTLEEVLERMKSGICN